MSRGDSSSHYSPSHHRCQSNLLPAPGPFPDVDLLSSVFDSVHAPGFQLQGAFPCSDASWPFHSPVQSLENDSQSKRAFPSSLQSHSSTLSLNSSVSLTGTILDLDTPLSGHESEQFFDSVNCEEQLTDENPQGLGITSYPMSVASGAYFAGPMQPNNNPYIWGNRPFQPLQSPPGHMNQQFPPSQPYPSSGFPVGYNGQPSGSLPSYHQDASAPPSYLPGAHGGSARLQQSRSPPALSMARPFHPQPNPAALPDQSLMTSSPPYMMNQPAYYLPEAPPIPSTHPSSMSLQASSMVAEPVFSSPDSIATGDSKERPLRVLSSRPRPQCWDHGCNGREFSTFSNLLRHQREKSGVVAKAECPVCGAVFTRTTARNIHVAQGKCKGPGRESSTE
ncbi:uncharacterized protein N7482_004319 [Penicillium canariense]|uniref:C2H2-type domain-containing protein n=1 Tax=Penicillium canariense TaxID=189055 RepID=A0A9W9I8X5_9EURO|nr:uncharacterized protein N7482_004319 [Penicillium canariense]KAJ5168725.1 hypothetical protein N7482_004319 [Penicillium canariense]